MPHPLHVYAADELGAYGYVEKPWYQPGDRLNAFLEELSARGLDDSVVLAYAPPATDQDLQIFHSPKYIQATHEACMRNEGSLDHVATEIIRDVSRLLEGVRMFAHTEGGVSVERLELEFSEHLVPAMNVEAYRTYLATEGLWEDREGMIHLTSRGASFLEDEAPSLPGPTLARASIEDAARWVCGAVLDATDRILSGELCRVFIPIAGFHHARSEEARGYCLYNDPVLAIKRALSAISGTVAYIDIDIHQGDGVYEAFADNPRVVIADIHEDFSTLFPFTPDQPSAGQGAGRRDQSGLGVGIGSKLNIPLSPNTTDAEYLALWEEAERFIHEAQPDFIIFESGVDGLSGDPMSHQQLTADLIYEVTRRVCQIADEHAEGRLLVLGGGGYEIKSMSRGWCAVVSALLES